MSLVRKRQGKTVPAIIFEMQTTAKLRRATESLRPNHFLFAKRTRRVGLSLHIIETSRSSASIGALFLLLAFYFQVFHFLREMMAEGKAGNSISNAKLIVIILCLILISAVNLLLFELKLLDLIDYLICFLEFSS